jgi:nucleoside-diphosphate-sugar epimerase
LRVAVTGGTGFVGAALITHLLDKGFEVRALARNPDLFDAPKNITVLRGSLEDEAALGALAEGVDVFFNLAGVTHARKLDEYQRTNVDGAVRAARAAAAVGAKFIHISSISARAPEVSPYARSKYDGEAAIRTASGDNPWLALRLPAIYGPGDMVTLPYFKLVKLGLALEPKTPTPAHASIIYVDDAAAAIAEAARAAPPGGVYEVGDERPEGHAWSEIGAILGEQLAKRPRAIRVPRALISVYHNTIIATERAFGRKPSVREGQVNEFFHPDWVARSDLLSDATLWRPTTPLKEGFAKTALWYQKNGLL